MIIRNRAPSHRFWSVLLLFLFLSLQVSHAREGIIGQITFPGLKRTSEKTALQIIRPVAVGGILTEETEEIIVQELRKSGIFHPDITVDTAWNDERVYLEVHVKDRWTLIPIPLFAASNGGSWTAGGLAIENNLLGFNKTLGLGCIYGSSGWTLISFFNDPLFWGNDLRVQGGFQTGVNEKIDQDADSMTVRNYRTDTISLGLGLELPLMGNTSLGIFVEWERFRMEGNESPLPAESDLTAGGITAELKWEDHFYGIPYREGVSARSSASWHWCGGDQEDFLTLEGAFLWAFRPWRNHLLSFSLEGGAGNLPFQKQFRLGGTTGSFILPGDKIAAEEYITASGSYNLPALFFSGGTLSLKTFYELGYFKSDLINRTLYHGPGIGLELFINDLAIPAISMNLGWNLSTGTPQFSAGIGMGG